MQLINGGTQRIQAAKTALSTELNLLPNQISVKLMGSMVLVALLSFKDRF